MGNSAVEKAACSRDPEIMHGILNVLCPGYNDDTSEKHLNSSALVEFERTRPTFRVLGERFVCSLTRRKQFETARRFHEEADNTRELACCAVKQAYALEDATERIKWLLYARACFGTIGLKTLESEVLLMDSCSHLTADVIELIKAQVTLQLQSEEDNWPGKPYFFVGLSLVDTIRLLISLSRTDLADALRLRLKVSDKRYWRMKVNALSDCGEVDALLAMKNLCPLTGYELLIKKFLLHQRGDLAKPLIPKVKSTKAQAAFYLELDMHDQARAVLAQGTSSFLGKFSFSSS